MHPFLASALGGVLIGASASLLLLGAGRVAGISGIVGGLADPRPGDVGWRVSFVAGLLVAGLLGVLAWPAAFGGGASASPLTLALAGLLVGFGTRLGNGCTSGHGVCGLARLSVRSLVSVLTFMGTGAVVVFLVRHVFGVS